MQGIAVGTFALGITSKNKGVFMAICLENLLSYRNEAVDVRYKKDYPTSSLTPEMAMQAFLKYVWLVHQHQSDIALNPNDPTLAFDCLIYEEMKDIDDYWHTFLLFTEDYHTFCKDHLEGHFFHHRPSNQARQTDQANHLLRLERYLNYIQKYFGDETLCAWFKMR